MTARRKGTLATPRILQTVETPDGNTVPIVDAIIEIVRQGGSRRAAAIWAGIHPATLGDWITRGLATWEEIDDNPTNPEKQATASENPEGPHPAIPDSERPYVDLARAILQAEVATEMGLVTGIYQAAKTEWKAAAFAIQARERGSWNPQPRVEVTGPGGGPLAHSVTALSDVQFARKMAELERRRAAALTVGEAASG